MKGLQTLFVSIFFWFFSWFFLTKFGLDSEKSLYLGAILASFETSLVLIIRLLSDIKDKLK